MLSLRRTTRLDPDTFVEELHVDESGDAVLWRSAGWATDPMTPVGRFRRRLDDLALVELTQALDAIAAAGDLHLPPPPGGAADTITAGAAQARLGVHAEPDGAWAPLVGLARQLLVDPASSPVAALDLRVGRDGLLLVHLGDTPVFVHPTHAWARAEREDDDGMPLAEWRTELPDLPPSIDKGWTLPVPLPPELLHGGGQVQGFAFLALGDGDARRPVSLATR